jgi:hypothetical protein
MKSNKLILLSLFFCQLSYAQTLSETQMRNARATGYAIVAARNPGVSFSVLMIPWDGVNTLEYNAQNQINGSWHAQAVVKGNYFYQTFDGYDFSSYSTVILSQAEFDLYKSSGTQWWIVCSTLAPFSSVINSLDGKIGIGTLSPIGVLDAQRAAHTSHIIITESSDEGLSPALFVTKRSRGTNLQSPSAIQNGNYLGGLSIQGYGTSYAEGARIYGIASEHWTGSGNGTDIVFATTANQQIGTQTRAIIKNDGNFGIGVLNPSEKLSVNGNIKAKKIIVSQTGWPDYVFAPAYKLRPLNELAAFIQKNQHLPDMPSAKDVEEKGISVGDNQALLLKKIEELTLYLIQLDEVNKKLVSEVEILKQKKKKNEK